jgi:valyl-tRNA synthetase
MNLPKTYEPNQYESDIYALWEKGRAFVPKNRGNKDSYTIVVPPPNANGNLHLGHGLTLAIEDIAVRYHRMKGEAALLLPGADHAGFETQVVYEKQLAKEGKSRFDFSREELYQQIWDFVAQNRDNYENQFRRLGAGVDWTRYTFTLDTKIVAQAYATFKKMWDEGLIYRGERLVNFCTFHGTAFADIEVAHKEVKGKLWYIRYPLTDGSGEVVVATTRPETMLGDTAVAVHTDDKRYAKFIGKTVKLPLTHREIPIIGDDMVEREFGTGAVKITPAHDPNDYEVAKRHDLPFISVIGHEGKITHDMPELYRGLTVEEARQKVISDLEQQGCLVKTEDHVHNVGHCYKCGTVLEPMLREQWFVDMQPLAKRAIEVLRQKKIVFHPDSKRTQLISYLEGLRDWNISRQIAWGIPIPAFQNVDDPEDWIFNQQVDQETLEMDGKTYRRDPDVFDTWFSSSSWPYATLGYPDGEDFKNFYPLSLMETGGEILNPWVSRMIMLGLYATGEVPFEAVYIHGYVMASDGSKMSKSIGNVVDPIPVIEKYGSDALRMGIIAGRAPAINRGYDVGKVEGARNFCNKLWNVARFIEDKVGNSTNLSTAPAPKTPADHWILNKLQQSTEKVAQHLENYRFADAYDEVYHLLWDDFADWYVESSKTDTTPGVLAYGLETILKLTHPFAPFVTETIWQTLAWQKDTMLATTLWPTPEKFDHKQAGVFDDIKSLVTEIRYVLTVLNAKNIELFHQNEPLINQNAPLIQKLGKLKTITSVDNGHGLRLTQTQAKVWLDIDNDLAMQYLANLIIKKTEAKQKIQHLHTRLGNKNYVDNAPPKLVQQTKDQLAEAEQLLDNISAEHTRFAALNK